MTNISKDYGCTCTQHTGGQVPHCLVHLTAFSGPKQGESVSSKRLLSGTTETSFCFCPKKINKQMNKMLHTTIMICTQKKYFLWSTVLLFSNNNNNNMNICIAQNLIQYLDELSALDKHTHTHTHTDTHTISRSLMSRQDRHWHHNYWLTQLGCPHLPLTIYLPITHS